ncbi:SdiA-regulated domain-containing protein [Desulfofustis limnaeus]|uniref:6-bladed beta-propeller n=1 Tax=Desulfofustis limnaeus TaxID=2740163 RepID=A0ABN6LZE7_9BACT|nr:SdiA-regulated domain-containing protein [Desulfofustis limnaeus]BDD86014.1 hypothetical protein DPPLL_03790 [Desulfofustis limnaeus]
MTWVRIILIMAAVVMIGCRSGRAGLEPHRVVVMDAAIAGPSDICLHPDGGTLLIVSDKGALFQADLDGEIKRRAPFHGGDFEGVYVHEKKIYVAEERDRLVYRFDSDSLEREKTYSVPYEGKRNSGYESVVFNRARDVFLLITEKDPVIVFELNGDFEVLKRFPLDVAEDISAATWHEGFLWLVSDEERAVLKLDPHSYEVLQRWEVPSVRKPEGIAFVGETMMLVCDAERRLYYFAAPR